MSGKIKVELELTIDEPNSIDFNDTFEGLNDNEWYKFEVNEFGGIQLQANKEGFEQLARYFLKLARTDKNDQFHSHHSLEYGKENLGEPELTVLLVSEESKL